MISNAIGVIVAWMPAGLPLALSMGLTIIARRLCVAFAVLLKRMGTIETMGSMSLLASDKTGTLTQNAMTVTSLILVSSQNDSVCEIIDADVAATALTTSVYTEQCSGASGGLDHSKSCVLKALLRCGTLCNQAKLQAVDTSM